MKNMVFCVCWAVLISACSFEEAIPKYTGNKGEPPELLDVQTVSPDEVRFFFSEPVSILSVTLDPPVGGLETTDGETVALRLEEPYAVGTTVTAALLVRNADGNTLESVLSFSAFNDRVPDFLINEMRSETSKPRVEFIELKMLSGGNLAGVRFFAASNGTRRPVYEFPAVEVSQGEYVLLHPRSPDYINTVDELGDDLGLSDSDDSKAQADCPKDARDIWIPSTKETLRKSDVVYFSDQMNNIIDAAAFCDRAKEAEKWSANPCFADAMDILAASGAWIGSTAVPGIDDSCDTSGVSPTNTLNRRESAADTNTAADWYKSGTGKASPGRKNTQP